MLAGELKNDVKKVAPLGPLRDQPRAYSACIMDVTAIREKAANKPRTTQAKNPANRPQTAHGTRTAAIETNSAIQRNL